MGIRLRNAGQGCVVKKITQEGNEEEKCGRRTKKMLKEVERVANRVTPTKNQSWSWKVKGVPDSAKEKETSGKKNLKFERLEAKEKKLKTADLTKKKSGRKRYYSR